MIALKFNFYVLIIDKMQILKAVTVGQARIEPIWYAIHP